MLGLTEILPPPPWLRVPELEPLDTSGHQAKNKPMLFVELVIRPDSSTFRVSHCWVTRWAEFQRTYGGATSFSSRVGRVHMEGLALSVAPVCLFHLWHKECWYCQHKLCRQYQHSLMDHCLVLYITTNQKFLRMRNLTCTAQHRWHVSLVLKHDHRPDMWVDDNRAETRRASCFARFQPQLWVKFWTKGCLWRSYHHEQITIFGPMDRNTWKSLV